MARDQYTFTNPAELYADIEPQKGHQPSRAWTPTSSRRPISGRTATAAADGCRAGRRSSPVRIPASGGDGDRVRP